MKKNYPKHFAPISTIGRVGGTVRFFVAAFVFAAAAHAALIYGIPEKTTTMLGAMGIRAIDGVAASAAPDTRLLAPPGAQITLEITTIRATTTEDATVGYPLTLPRP